MKNQRIIHWWMGTDALKLVKVPPGKFTWRFRIYAERLLWKALEPFFSEHWVVSEHLRSYLTMFGIKYDKIKVVPDPPLNLKRYKRKKHVGFNVLYYCRKDSTNQKFKDWCYGWDIYLELKRRLNYDVHWIVIDGSQNMDDVYPYIDAYIRPNRADGWSRTVEECRFNGIPVMATRESPDVDEFERWIRCIKS